MSGRRGRGETGGCALRLHRLRSHHLQPHRRHQGQSPGGTDRERSVAREHRRNSSHMLKRELELREKKLLDELHYRTLERIFIEERIYKAIEKCKTNEAVIAAVYDGFKPFKKQLVREIVDADVEKLVAGSHPPDFALRHQQASRGDGEDEGGPRRDAQESEEPHEIRHRPSRSVAGKIRPAVSAPDHQVRAARGSGREGRRVQGVQGRLRPRERLRRLQGQRRGIQDWNARSSTRFCSCSRTALTRSPSCRRNCSSGRNCFTAACRIASACSPAPTRIARRAISSDSRSAARF